MRDVNQALIDGYKMLTDEEEVVLEKELSTQDDLLFEDDFDWVDLEGK